VRGRKSETEGRRLVAELFSLETSTLIVARPADQELPTMQAMLEDLHANYRSVTGQARETRFDEIATSLRERPSDAAAGVPVERISAYGDRLHEIVNRAGGVVSDAGLAIDERKLTPADAATITRAWELALDPIHMSTTVWLDDGDIVTHYSARGSGASTAAVVGFHTTMVGLGMKSWQALMQLVAQFLATLVRLVLGRIRLRGLPSRLAPPAGLPSRLAPPAAPAPAATWASRGVRKPDLLRRAQAMFGTGGKLFMTDAPGGSGGGLRTLVQLTGEIVTRGTPDSIADADTLEQHMAKIEAWFLQLNRDWRRARIGLSSLGAAGAVTLVAFDVTTLSPAGAWQLLLPLMFTLIPFAVISALGFLARRLILHAVKGPRALLPARS
jgi:hypothetical protein